MGHTSEFPFGIYWWTLKNPKNQTFEKTRKKIAGDIMILHILQLYEVQLLRYGVRQFFFVILGLFLAFTPPPPLPLITQKTKILKKWKKRPEMSSC